MQRVGVLAEERAEQKKHLCGVLLGDAEPSEKSVSKPVIESPFLIAAPCSAVPNASSSIQLDRTQLIHSGISRGCKGLWKSCLLGNSTVVWLRLSQKGSRKDERMLRSILSTQVLQHTGKSPCVVELVLEVNTSQL